MRVAAPPLPAPAAGWCVRKGCAGPPACRRGSRAGVAVVQVHDAGPVDAGRADGPPPEAKAGLLQLAQYLEVLQPGAAYGPITAGIPDEKTAISRVSPASTGRTYTMTTRLRPVCGRASTRLSIFTASTSRGLDTGSPVKGDSSSPATKPGPDTGPHRGRQAEDQRGEE